MKILGNDQPQQQCDNRVNKDAHANAHNRRTEGIRERKNGDLPTLGEPIQWHKYAEYMHADV